MKKSKIILQILLFTFTVNASSQNNRSAIPAGYMEQIKKMLPPGTQLPPEFGGQTNSEETEKMKPLIEMAPVQTYEYPEETTDQASPIQFGSGRNELERKMAVDAIDAELELKPLLLPKKENAPSKSYMLELAQVRSKSAHTKFSPDELSAYSKAVNWIPRFDGLQPDKQKAREMSMLVSASTNYLNLPNFIQAVSSEVVALDPQSVVASTNFASAIITAGERINSSKLKSEALTSYWKDAESGFLYAIAISMKDDSYTEKSLTPILNLGNMYIDMHKVEEARSLFQLARKLSPLSWDAALGMAAYFHAIGKPDKALAILEDDKLDKPAMLMIAKKSSKALEKSEPFSQLPIESPDAKYEEGIKTMISEPILTSADFIAQIDQSQRNKMRYFIENLATAGSYSVPKINKISQYSTLKSISSPQGVSALEEFQEMLSRFTFSSAASNSKQQLKMLSEMGLDIDLGIDMDDVAKHPEKYKDKHLKNNVKVSGMDNLMANVEKMKKQALLAQKDLASGNINSTLTLASQIDPYFNILLLDPEKYADPMNILIQKHNFAVYYRKKRLYESYMYSVNKRMTRAVQDDILKTQKKIGEIYLLQTAELESFERKYEQAKKAHTTGTFPEAEWKLRRHAIHTKYFNQFNNIAEIGFGSSTNVASVGYVQKIKPTAEGYYYDVIRHIGLISDKEIRDRKDTELKISINSAVSWALQTVLMAHASFSYSDDWDCECDLEALLREREKENEEIHKEENERIIKNKAAKAVFDSGEIPKSSPLWKRLDSYVDEYNLGFIKVRSSCAQTVVKLNTDILPIPGIPSLFGTMTTSENTGATDYDGGMKIGIGVEKNGVKAEAGFSLTASVSTDGQGVVKDYSITPGVDLSVKVGDTGMSVAGSLTFDKSGLKDSDFSAGVSQDFKNGYGTEGKVALEVSTKRGCSLSGEVSHDVSVKPPKDPNDKSDEDKISAKDDTEEKFFKKSIWSGQIQMNK